MDYESLSLQGVEFLDEHESAFDQWFSILANPNRPPVRYRKKLHRPATIDNLASLFGFEESNIKPLLAYHRRRLRRHAIVVLSVWLILTGLISLFIYLLTTSVFRVGDDNAYLAMYAATFMFYILVVPSVRLASALSDKFFAESLCVQAIVHVLLELSRNDVLVHPSRKQALQKRIGRLARYTALLPVRYPSESPNVQGWTWDHFYRMKAFIRERERWVITPKDTTLSDLRRDFHDLASKYITGMYGEFCWGKIPPDSQPARPTWRQRFGSTLPRVLGVVLPASLLAFVITQPEFLVENKIDPNPLFWILTAWLTLGLDQALNLGITNTIATLAKGYKDLTGSS